MSFQGKLPSTGRIQHSSFSSSPFLALHLAYSSIDLLTAKMVRLKSARQAMMVLHASATCMAIPRHRVGMTSLLKAAGASVGGNSLGT